jgi:phosphoribosylaminoimidazolecarboxamide formyltransferase/IMP cyclohydrolase
VGGPTMVRSAAKNYHDVTIITSADQYEELIDELKRNKGSTSLEFREKLSRIAFTETAYYDSVISDYFNKRIM